MNKILKIIVAFFAVFLIASTSHAQTDNWQQAVEDSVKYNDFEAIRNLLKTSLGFIGHRSDSADLASNFAAASFENFCAFAEDALWYSDGANWNRIGGSAGGGGGIDNVVEDTSPQLGGTLDAQGNSISDAGNITMNGAATVDGRDVSVDGAKLDLFTTPAGSTADYTFTSFFGSAGTWQPFEADHVFNLNSYHFLARNDGSAGNGQEVSFLDFTLDETPESVEFMPYFDGSGTFKRFTIESGPWIGKSGQVYTIDEGWRVELTHDGTLNDSLGIASVNSATNSYSMIQANTNETEDGIGFVREDQAADERSYIRIGNSGSAQMWSGTDAEPYLQQVNVTGSAIGFVAGTSAVTMTTSANFAGMEYDADYSADFTNRSLVDKAYVDAQVGSSASFTGVQEADDFDLRATDTNETLQFQAIQGNITQYLSMKNGTADGISMSSVNSDISTTASVEADTDGEPDVFIYAGEDSESMSMIKLDTTEVLMIAGYGPDFANPASWDLGKYVTLDMVDGLAYGADYSADFTNRSLVDKEYVDLAVTGGGGGDVSKVGTPANDQVGIWTGDGTIEGDPDLIFDGTDLTTTGDVNAVDINASGSFFDTDATTNTMAMFSTSGQLVDNKFTDLVQTVAALTDSDKFLVELNSGGAIRYGNMQLLENYIEDNILLTSSNFSPGAVTPTLGTTIETATSLDDNDISDPYRFARFLVDPSSASIALTIDQGTADTWIELTNTNTGSNAATFSAGSGMTLVGGSATLDPDEIALIYWESATKARIFVSNSGGGSGDVSKVGTPVNDQVGIWTGDGTIEGDPDLTFDGTDLTLGGDLYLNDNTIFDLFSIFNQSGTVTTTIQHATGDISLSAANSGPGSDAEVVVLDDGYMTFDIDDGTNARGMQFDDEGLKYDADYSGSYVARSLVDKAYVDAQAGGSDVYIVKLTNYGDDLTTGVADAWHLPHDITIDSVAAGVTTVPTDAAIVIDIHLNGTTIMTTDKIEIDATTNHSREAATQPALTTTSASMDDIMLFEVDQIGSTIAGANGTVFVYYTKQ